ncbi:MAG TPA: tRNA (adenosine(37)-N6)-dimethylallyltransferase MiaA [Egibacteraceae bacterium]|nr:tRNA (adenosine(37)-N6)-dimethylallyltransferase MiaA [Egibacteraceae bacterium]
MPAGTSSRRARARTLPRADPRPVLALVGPTGVGKSQLALTAARRLRAEIVAVDAFTVYRDMDVGTAKPSPDERAAVAHHMVDVLDPCQECTVQWFQAAARASVADIVSRGRVPLLVGGSGLYFRAVVDPLEFPPTDRTVRAAVAARYPEARSAHAALAALDPAAAGRMEAANFRRAVRALEVIELTGRAFSDWRRAWDEYHSVYPGLRVVGVALPRDELVARLDARVDAMVGRGLVPECRVLTGRTLSRSARQAIGYAEVLDHLAGRLTLAEAVERMKVRTRRYAARQARWFAADPRVQWKAPADVVPALA